MMYVLENVAVVWVALVFAGRIVPAMRKEVLYCSSKIDTLIYWIIYIWMVWLYWYALRYIPELITHTDIILKLKP